MSNTVVKKRIHEEVEQSDTRLLQMIDALIKVYKKDTGLTPQTIEAYKKELDESLAAAESGDFITLEDLEKENEAMVMIVRSARQNGNWNGPSIIFMSSPFKMRNDI